MRLSLADVQDVLGDRLDGLPQGGAVERTNLQGHRSIFGCVTKEGDQGDEDPARIADSGGQLVQLAGDLRDESRQAGPAFACPNNPRNNLERLVSVVIPTTSPPRMPGWPPISESAMIVVDASMRGFSFTLMTLRLMPDST